MSIDEKRTIGRLEWASLPELGLPFIKAKTDTGAKSSALHAYNIKHFKENSIDYVSFYLHPIQNNIDITRQCKAKLSDIKTVKSSNGQVQERLTITTQLIIGSYQIKTPITLTNRSNMTYRMLLGRDAMEGLIVDPNKSFIHGKHKKKTILNAYTD